jgi:hypothetical protein
MTLYIIRDSDYFVLLEINFYFCSIHTFSSVKIDTEIDEVRRSEDVDGIKYTSCLNFCSSMTLYIIRVLNYSASLEINCHFYSIYAFSSVEIDTEIDEVHRSEDVDGTKHAFCSRPCFSIILNIIKDFIRN